MTKGSRRVSFQHLLQRFLLHEGQTSFFESHDAIESHIEADLSATLQRYCILQVGKLDSLTDTSLSFTLTQPLGWGDSTIRCDKRDIKTQLKSLKIPASLCWEVDAIIVALRSEGAKFTIHTDGNFVALNLSSPSKARCSMAHSALFNVVYTSPKGRLELLVWNPMLQQKVGMSFLRIDLEKLISCKNHTKIAG